MRALPPVCTAFPYHEGSIRNEHAPTAIILLALALALAVHPHCLTDLFIH